MAKPKLFTIVERKAARAAGRRVWDVYDGKGYQTLEIVTASRALQQEIAVYDADGNQVYHYKVIEKEAANG